MFSNIMIPIDLGHPARQTRAIKAAADLAKLYNAQVTFVGVTSEQPSGVAHNPAEFSAKLSEYVSAEAAAHGIDNAHAHALAAHDPTAELDALLLKTSEEMAADLIVMNSHIPRSFDWSSHGGRLATHAHASVMLVRDED